MHLPYERTRDEKWDGLADFLESLDTTRLAEFALSREAQITSLEREIREASHELLRATVELELARLFAAARAKPRRRSTGAAAEIIADAIRSLKPPPRPQLIARRSR